MRRSPKNLGKNSFQNTFMDMKTSSPNMILMNYPLLDPGIMPSNYYLVQNIDLIARFIPSVSMNKNNWTNSSRNIYVQDESDHLNPQWRLPSSLQRKKMELF